MIDGTFLDSGQEGILYKCKDNSVLKVFYRDFHPNSIDRGYSENLATQEFSNMVHAFENKIKVPKPIQLLTVTLDAEDLKDVKKLEYRINGEYPYNEKMNPYSLIGETRFAIKRQFIAGKSLYEKIFPSKKIRQKIYQLHEEIDRAGFIYSDVKANNYILTPNNDIYIIDCQYLVPKDHIIGILNENWKQQKISTCKIEEWFGIIKATLKSNPF